MAPAEDTILVLCVDDDPVVDLTATFLGRERDYETAHYGTDGERVVIDGTVRPVTNDGAVVTVIVDGRTVPPAERGAGSDSSPAASAADSSSVASERVTETVTETQTESETVTTEDDN